jgi:hypothetical protein
MTHSFRFFEKKNQKIETKELPVPVISKAFIKNQQFS